MLFRELEFLDRINATREAGYPAFEFWRWRGDRIKAIQERNEALGLNVAAFCVEPMGSIVDPSTHNEFLNGVKESIQVAKELGTEHLIVTTGKELKDVPRNVQHNAIVTALKAAAPMAEETGITLVLEPLNTIVNHKGYYLSTSAEGFDILREVGSERIKLLYDIYHQQITEGNLIETITNNIDFIGHFHVIPLLENLISTTSQISDAERLSEAKVL
jgi:hydroxypyruvate isomerase